MTGFCSDGYDEKKIASTNREGNKAHLDLCPVSRIPQVPLMYSPRSYPEDNYLPTSIHGLVLISYLDVTSWERKTHVWLAN
ncbi:hypothetical protein RRG08_059747 [Elysia crispata]|uniref:Uncharacterized protein n=1 Tax=Elysia crispata TaxID=231223 RepID=A0AAE1EEJ5_9GAST|nr:hypothetical protein RRG08_059747 [Elysia crispata]